jgi:hypothetical protein
MENKLELRHLCPYLPYKLKAKFMHPVVKHQKIGVINNAYNLDDDVKISIDYSDDEHIWMFKPILRPLSDLTREDLIEDLGTETSCLDWTTSEREHWIKFYSREHWINNLPYLIYSHLVKNHFDVFGLIEAGLAIDINTLKN